MLKQLWVAIFLGIGLSALAGAGPMTTVPDQLKARLNSLVPGADPDSVTETPVKGLYEVTYGPEVVYLSTDGRYMLSGSLYDLDTRKNLTDRSRTAARKVVLDQLDEGEMVVYAPEDTKHTITVFTDVDCPYCRKLHAEIGQYKDLGIKVRYLMFPRAGVGSASYDKAVSILCSADRNAALDKAKQGLPVASKKCDNPVEKQLRLGRELGVTGTPAILLEDGELIPGYRPAKDMAALLAHQAQASAGR